MTKSESIKNLAEALCKFQASMEAITKDATNPFFKSKYASLSAIIEDTRAPLAKQGLSYAQFPSSAGYLETILMHTSGEWLADTFAVLPIPELRKVDGKVNLALAPIVTPQALGSAITYARRYALCSILGLQVEDDDGNEASKPEVKVAGPKVVTDKRDAQKKRIKELADDVALVPLETGDDYKEWVVAETGLELIPENYTKIIDALEIKNG